MPTHQNFLEEISMAPPSTTVNEEPQTDNSDNKNNLFENDENAAAITDTEQNQILLPTISKTPATSSSQSSFVSRIFSNLSAPFQCFVPMFVALGVAKSNGEEGPVLKKKEIDSEDMTQSSDKEKRGLLSFSGESDSEDDSSRRTGVDRRYYDDRDDDDEEQYFRRYGNHHGGYSGKSAYSTSNSEFLNGSASASSFTFKNFEENSLLTEEEIRSLNKYQETKYNSIEPYQILKKSLEIETSKMAEKKQQETVAPTAEVPAPAPVEPAPHKPVEQESQEVSAKPAATTSTVRTSESTFIPLTESMYSTASLTNSQLAVEEPVFVSQLELSTVKHDEDDDDDEFESTLDHIVNGFEDDEEQPSEVQQPAEEKPAEQPPSTETVVPASSEQSSTKQVAEPVDEESEGYNFASGAADEDDS